MIMMNVKIAVAALKSAKTRTVLTMTGIVVGVASVTLILALGEGIKREVTGQISNLGTDIIQVRPGKPGGGDSGELGIMNRLAPAGPSTLTETDVATAARTPGVAAAAPLMMVPGSVSHNGRDLEHPFIVATTPELPQILHIKLTHGEFFNPAIQNNVAVLGQGAATKLLGTDNQVGGKITIRGQEYTVIGILEGSGAAATLGGLAPSLGNIVYIPLSAGGQAYGGQTPVHEIEIKLKQDRDASEVAAALARNLADRRQGEQDFGVVTQEQALQSTNTIIRSLTTFTAAIAAISLLVGGIGIMNIMLVSVSERTREIGIRKSIGATNGQILSQFLIEAVVISIGGGLIGIGLAAIISTGLALRTEITPALTLPALGLAFGISSAVGIVFGIAPAVHAARKDPIEALRHE